MSNFAITENDKEVTGNVPIGSGIHDDIEMLKPSFESLKEGNPPVLKLNFKDEEGRSHSEVIWDIDADRERENAVKYEKTHPRDVPAKGWTKGEQIKPDEAVEIAYANFRQRLKHVATKFVDEETVTEATKGATSYEDFSKKYSAIFTDEVLEAGNPVRLKLAENQAGYATLPKYPPFIETMNTVPSRLEFSQYEKQVMAQNNEANASDPETFGGDEATSFNPADFEDKASF